MFFVLVRAARALPIQASYTSPTLALPLRRWIFSPSLKPPPTGPSIRQEFPKESRAHVSQEQFKEVRHTDLSPPNSSAYYGLHDEQPGSYKKSIRETPEERWANKASQFVTQLASTYAGRSVQVTKEGDVGLAYNKLQAILRQNNVRRELRLAERHEKKGVKRRRLRSERWKRKFADEVRKKVKLVTEIRLRDRMWGASRH